MALGFLLMIGGLVTGAFTRPEDGYSVILIWVSLIGLGLGLALPPAMGSLSSEHGGAGSGLLQALRQVGGTLGVTILGTVLNAGYRSRLPANVPASVRDHATAGLRLPGLARACRFRARHDQHAVGVCGVLRGWDDLDGGFPVAFPGRCRGGRI